MELISLFICVFLCLVYIMCLIMLYGIFISNCLLFSFQLIPEVETHVYNAHIPTCTTFLFHSIAGRFLLRTKRNSRALFMLKKKQQLFSVRICKTIKEKRNVTYFICCCRHRSRLIAASIFFFNFMKVQTNKIFSTTELEAFK